MKLAGAQIDAFINNPNASGALVYGPDAGLAQERAQKLSAAAVSDVKDPFSVAHLTEARILQTPSLLADELAAMSLTSPHRLVVVSDVTDKLAPVLAEAEIPGSGVFLLLVGGELTPRSALRKWAESSPRIAALPCYHDDGPGLERLIREHFSTAGKRVGREVVSYLSSCLGADRLATRAELDKLLTYCAPETEITLDAAMACIGDAQEVETEACSMAIASGDFKAVDRALSVLLHEGMAPVQLARVLQRYFLRLYTLRAAMDSGEPPEQAMQSLRPPVFYKHVPAVRKQAQSWTLPRLKRALSELLELERQLKREPRPELMLSRMAQRVASMAKAA